MRIGNGPQPVVPVNFSKSRVNNAYGTTSVPSQKDELTISSQAKDFSLVMNALRKVPDVRAEKVAEFSSAVEAGTYSVPAKDVSDKIIAALSAKRI